MRYRTLFDKVLYMVTCRKYFSGFLMVVWTLTTANTRLMRWETSIWK